MSVSIVSGTRSYSRKRLYRAKTTTAKTATEATTSVAPLAVRIESTSVRDALSSAIFARCLSTGVGRRPRSDSSGFRRHRPLDGPTRSPPPPPLGAAL